MQNQVDSNKTALSSANYNIESLPSQDYQSLLTQVEYVSSKLDNLTNLSIVIMIGISLLVGIIVVREFSSYIRSV